MVHAVEHGRRHEGLHRLDDGAGRLEAPGRRLDRRAHLGLDRQAAAGVQQQADPQAAQLFSAQIERIVQAMS